MSSHAVKIFNSVYQAQIGLAKGTESLQQHQCSCFKERTWTFEFTYVAVLFPF